MKYVKIHVLGDFQLFSTFPRVLRATPSLKAIKNSIKIVKCKKKRSNMVQTLWNFEWHINMSKYMFYVIFSLFRLFLAFCAPPLAQTPIFGRKQPTGLKKVCTVGASLPMFQKKFQPERSTPTTLFARGQRITGHDKTISTFYGLMSKKVLTLTLTLTLTLNL